MKSETQLGGERFDFSFFVFLDRSAARSKSLPDSFIDEDTGFHRELEKKKRRRRRKKSSFNRLLSSIVHFSDTAKESQAEIVIVQRLDLKEKGKVGSAARRL